MDEVLENPTYNNCYIIGKPRAAANLFKIKFLFSHKGLSTPIVKVIIIVARMKMNCMQIEVTLKNKGSFQARRHIP